MAAMRSDRVGGKAVQPAVTHIGRVEADQVPCPKAACAKRKPRLAWGDDKQPRHMGADSNRAWDFGAR